MARVGIRILLLIFEKKCFQLFTIDCDVAVESFYHVTKISSFILTENASKNESGKKENILFFLFLRKF